MVRELCAGDEVLLVCGNEGNCSLGGRIGFLIKGVAFKEEVVMGLNEVRVERAWLFESIGQSQGPVSSGSGSKRVFAVRGDEIMVPDFDFLGRKCGGVIEKSRFLLSHCRGVLRSDDPITYIMQCNLFDTEMDVPCVCIDKSNYSVDLAASDRSKFPVQGEKEVNGGVPVVRDEVQHHSLQIDQGLHTDRAKNERDHVCAGRDHLYQKDVSTVHFESCVAKNACKTSSLNTMTEESAPGANSFIQINTWKNCCPPPGKKFYLNRLQVMDRGSSSHPNVISLPELLYPVESISRIFIATFTSDILWFLSHCEIPCHLPVTIACHNTERCWNSSPDYRTSVPYTDFPNLVVVFPPFPESIAFGQDRKRKGIACHHPKLLVLQREDSIRVIITSANLVSNQVVIQSEWNNVTNTVWWQDFPARSAPDPSPLFIRVSDGDANKDSRSDFAAQLAGFMASLVINVPSQAYWISELTKYNFEGANGHLVTSVPGIHSRRSPNLPSGSSSVQFLGSVEASVVGLSHLFHTAADRNGLQLKQLAAFLGKCCENVYGMSEIVLRRNLNVPADVNAVSILVPNPDQFSGGALLSKYDEFDANRTRSCILLTCCFNSEVYWHLAIGRGQYKWPDSQQSDFIYGSSSVGSVNAQFLAAFSAAAGKRSPELFDSEESDPEWGCWSASQELINPSIKIIFPTIERVKNACNGILPSRRILCFSEKTWQRLRSVGILHDAIPHPYDRVGQPMHVKVACRRFQSKTNASSFGWVYCGSHNFSAAAWGRLISNPFGLKSKETEKTNSYLSSRLHVSNYELGIIFTFPPTETKGITNKDSKNLDDIVLPFVVPAPKYGPTDRPATARAMSEAVAELAGLERDRLIAEELIEEIPDEEEEAVEATDYAAVEKEEEKAYAEMLWNQVDSSQSF
uniref:HIRAN domain-containing protein n=1 Tax=Salix viminalis TaxID=40686 RepID=A0A6N2KZH2_SALVM